MSHNLTDLPFEVSLPLRLLGTHELKGYAQLLLEIHFLATSSALPVTNRHFQSTFRNVTNQYKARWLFRLTAAEKSLKSTKAKLQVITDALTYPLCNLPVFCILFTLLYPKDPRPDPDDGASLIKKSSKRRVKLPRRLFKIPPKVNKFKIPEDHMRLLRFLLESTLAHPE